VRAFGVQRLQGGPDAVGAAGEGGVGHDGAAAGVGDGVGDRPVTAGDGDGADIGGFGAAQDVHDHRHAGDHCQRLARQARGREPGRYDGDWVQRMGCRAAGACLQECIAT
jgi:hypothetical protein